MNVNDRGEIHFDWSNGLPALTQEEANVWYKGSEQYQETVWDRIKSKFTWGPVSQAPNKDNLNSRLVYDGYYYDPQLGWLVQDLKSGKTKLDSFASTVDWSKAEKPWNDPINFPELDGRQTTELAKKGSGSGDVLGGWGSVAGLGLVAILGIWALSSGKKK